MQSAKWLVWTVLAMATGCGPQDTSFQLAGTVTFKGEPVPAGVMFFDPDAAKGNDGVQGYAEIKDGKYDTRLGGRGVQGGPYQVRIHACDGKPGQELPMGKPLLPEATVAAEFPKANSTWDVDLPVK